jgi:hypothetical protein
LRIASAVWRDEAGDVGFGGLDLTQLALWAVNEKRPLLGGR